MKFLSVACGIMTLAFWFAGSGCMSYSYRTDVDMAKARTIKPGRAKYYIASFKFQNEKNSENDVLLYNLFDDKSATTPEEQEASALKRLNEYDCQHHPELFAGDGEAAVPLAVALKVSGGRCSGETLAHVLGAVLAADMMLYPACTVDCFDYQLQVKPVAGEPAAATAFYSKHWLYCSPFSPVGLIYWRNDASVEPRRGVLITEDVNKEQYIEVLTDAIALEILKHDREYAALTKVAAKTAAPTPLSSSRTSSPTAKAPGGGVVAPSEPATSGGITPF